MDLSISFDQTQTRYSVSWTLALDLDGEDAQSLWTEAGGWERGKG